MPALTMSATNAGLGRLIEGDLVTLPCDKCSDSFIPEEGLCPVCGEVLDKEVMWAAEEERVSGWDARAWSMEYNGHGPGRPDDWTYGGGW